MPIETGTTIAELDSLWPLGGDPILEGDNHLRLIKSILKAQFPGEAGEGLAAVIEASEAELNYLVGVTSSIQEQIDAITLADQNKFPIGHLLFTIVSDNPNTYGYPGSWSLIEGDTTFSTSSDISDPFINTIQGDNEIAVPLLAHNHNFTGTPLDDHDHDLKFRTRGGEADNSGIAVSGQNETNNSTVRTMSTSSFEAIGKSAGTPSGSISNVGVSNATIDVQGKRYILLCWKRIA